MEQNTEWTHGCPLVPLCMKRQPHISFCKIKTHCVISHRSTSSWRCCWGSFVWEEVCTGNSQWDPAARVTPLLWAHCLVRMGQAALPLKVDVQRRQRRDHLSRQITCLWISEDACTPLLCLVQYKQGYYLCCVFFYTPAGHVMYSGQEAHLTAREGGRQGGRHAPANCRQSVRRI